MDQAGVYSDNWAMSGSIERAGELWHVLCRPEHDSWGATWCGFEEDVKQIEDLCKMTNFISLFDFCGS